MLKDRLAAYTRSYSESRFWQKIRIYGHKAGFELLDKALRLYYVLQKPDLPSWARAAVVGALGYFVWPLDSFPDIAPFVGFTDDLTVIGAALATVALHVDDEVKRKALDKAEQWIGLSSTPQAGASTEDEDREEG